MSSGSSSRYQSKLFKFFNQQSQRLTQKWENSFRNLQVATKWSVEALLYPLYQLFQPDELAGKRLKSETPPAVDAPIQHILELVESLPSAAAADAQNSQNINPFKLLGDNLRQAFSRFGWSKGIQNQPEFNISKSLKPENTLHQHIPKVLGIAAQLENRQLVLVTNDNRILDVLTIQQQAKIADKINSEIAEYSYNLKLSEEVKKEQELLPKIDRILTKLTGETNTKIANFSENNIQVNSLAYPGKFLALLDNVAAKLETSSLVPVKLRSQEIIQVAKNKLDIFIYGREQLEARSKNSVDADQLETQPRNISALIAAAINYFFGGRNIHQFDDQSVPEKPSIKSANQVNQNHQLPQSDLSADIWLSWGDLFGNSEINADEEVNEINIDLPDSSCTENTQTEFLAKSKKGLFKKRIYAKVAADSQVGSEKKTQYQIQPDWIETTATFLGYEIHPLEQILAWLDHIMLWLEMIFINVIYFLKGLLQAR